jgi:hypothetical protein
MKSRTFILGISVSLLVPPAADAGEVQIDSQTIVKAIQCSGCSPNQMKSAAIAAPGLGVIFIYDIGSATIRKYERYNDTTCGADPAPTAAGKPGSPRCSAFRAADEETVDEGVQSIFNSLLDVEQVNPGLVLHAAASFQIGAGNGAIDPHTGRPFDLPNIAWDYPQGTYTRFNDFLQETLASEASANNFIPGLGTYLYSYQQSSRNVSISFSGQPGITVTLSWDRNNTTTMKVCNVDNDCVRYTIANTTSIVLTYGGVTDSTGNYYPSPNAHTPANPIWNWRAPHGGGDGNHFADGLRGNGVPVTDMDGCGINDNYILTCSWRGATFIDCSLDCGSDP